jgi:hypothetical protein
MTRFVFSFIDILNIVPYPNDRRDKLGVFGMNVEILSSPKWTKEQLLGKLNLYTFLKLKTSGRCNPQEGLVPPGAFVYEEQLVRLHLRKPSPRYVRVTTDRQPRFLYSMLVLCPICAGSKVIPP